jgi:ABC-type transporter Mla subunit MlaD
MSPTNDGVALDTVHDAYQDLYNALTDGYWAASTIENKDKIHGLMDIVFDILTELNRDTLEADSQEFKDIAAHLKSANDQLNNLKAQIDKLIAAVKIATKVAAGIDKAVSLAAKYFGL